MEIGSEYWKIEEELNKDNSKFWNIGKDIKFTLSGRTAIDFVLNNILLKKHIKKVYMPSYCCDTMIYPFKNLGIEVKYYDVYNNQGLKYNINLQEECDLFFAMNYFGYSNTNMEMYIKHFKKRGITVIEDVTHSILTNKRNSQYSDYLIGSLRKWFPIASGGIAVSMNSKFDINLNNCSNQKLINTKSEAMQNKKRYIVENKGEKEVFLNKYIESDKILDVDYKMYSIDNESYKIIMGMDLEKIKKQRMKNVQIIYRELKSNHRINFLVEEYKKDDCLLFVPILLNTELRNSLKKYMIQNRVYLPIHWPLEEKINNIFTQELSLVCDQRYTEKQIQEYIELIIEFLKNN